YVHCPVPLVLALLPCRGRLDPTVYHTRTNYANRCVDLVGRLRGLLLDREATPHLMHAGVAHVAGDVPVAVVGEVPLLDLAVAHLRSLGEDVRVRAHVRSE